jgi:hypothetical protein
VDRAILDGESVRSIAHLFSLKPTAVQTHKTEHLAPRVAAVIREHTETLKAEATDWLDDVHEARAKALANYQWAKTEGDPPDANGAVASLLKVAELKARGIGAFAKAEAKAYAEYGFASEDAARSAARQLKDLETFGEGDMEGRLIELARRACKVNPGLKGRFLDALELRDCAEAVQRDRVGQNGGELVSEFKPTNGTA